MPMNRDDHEGLLEELLNPELEHQRKTEVLQQLRTDYATVLQEQEDLTGKNEKLKNDNYDLVTSNSQMFRKLGQQEQSQEESQEQEEKEFSETVTIEDLE